MDVIKIIALQCRPVQRLRIESWQRSSGRIVEYHHSIYSLRKSIADCKKVIVLVGWCSRFSDRSAGILLQAKQVLNQSSYLIALSSTDNELEIEKALRLGADRYIHTECSDQIFSELLGAVTRRMGDLGFEQHYPPYGLNQMTQEVYVQGKRVDLTPREFRVAQYLFENPDRVITRTTMLRAVWDMPALDRSRRVDTKVSHVRRKMSLDGTYGWLLEFVRGKGYQLRSRVAIQSKNYKQQVALR